MQATRGVTASAGGAYYFNPNLLSSFPLPANHQQSPTSPSPPSSSSSPSLPRLLGPPSWHLAGRAARNEHHASSNSNLGQIPINLGSSQEDSRDSSVPPLPPRKLSSGGVAVISIFSLFAFLGCTVAVVSALRSRRRDAEAGRRLLNNRVKDDDGGEKGMSKRQRVMQKNIDQFKKQYESATGTSIPTPSFFRQPQPQPLDHPCITPPIPPLPHSPPHNILEKKY